MIKGNKVVLVGAMNVGKSTLFNRLSAHRKSIATDFEGVTRDFLTDRVSWRDYEFTLIDSGGIDLKKTTDPLYEAVRKKVFTLIDQASVILFMVDGKGGVRATDEDIAAYLRTVSKPVIVVVNKIDTRDAQEHLYDFYGLGFPDVVGISAEHGTAINDLLDHVVDHLPHKEIQKEERPAYRVVFIGKPNVGKSSLMNALLQEERTLVSDVPGTTREAISESLRFEHEAVEITDTPGIRRKRSIEEDLETLMVKSSFSALKGAHIAVLLIDGSSNTLVDQELKLAFYAFTDLYRALILLVNKADLMDEQGKAGLKIAFAQYPHLIKKIPVLEISCKTGKNVNKVLPLIQKVNKRYSQEFERSEITALFKRALTQKPLMHKTEKLEVYSVRQVRTAPITIELGVNVVEWFGPSQLAFFENLLRSEYDMIGVPVKFIVKKG